MILSDNNLNSLIILEFLQISYEPFHLTGDEGVLEELDNYVFGSL